MGDHWLSLLRPQPALHPRRMNSESVVDLVTGVRPSGRPGPTERSRSRNLGTPSAGQCRRARERRRWWGIGLTGNGSPTAIHPARHDDPRALGGDGDTRIYPSGRPGLIGPFTRGLRRCSGTPRLHSPGVRRITPRIEGNRMRPRYPSRADPTGHGIHGTSPQLIRRPKDPRCRNRARIPSRLDAAASYCTLDHFTA